MNYADYMALIEEHGGKKPAARALGIASTTFRDRVKSAAKREGLQPHESELAAAGYRMDAEDLTPEAAWSAHVSSFERKLSSSRKEHVIKRSGAFVVFHATDEHVDDDSSALNLLADDIAASHEMGAVMAHGGDLLNNWPMGGRLAKQWAEQSCTRPHALLRARHFIDIFKPDVWVDGNHEEMNPYLLDLFDTWLPKNTARDYWRIDFRVEVKGGRTLRAALSHKFQKGNSWFHAMHGHIREMLQSEERDLYMDGHYHQAGAMQHYLPERGHTATLVASAGYKLTDKWATRISRGGKKAETLGRCHWIVCDPFTDGPMCQAFTDPARAEAYLGALQNLTQV